MAHSTSRTCLISSSDGKSIVTPACHLLLSQTHDIFDALKRGGCRGAYRVRTLLEDFLQRGQIVHQFVIARLDGCQRCYQLFGERVLEIAVTLTRELCFDLLS